MRYLWVLSLCVLFSPPAEAGGEKELRYDNYIYEPTIQSVQFQTLAANQTLPLIVLNSGDKLKLTFDELTSRNDYYQYTIVHCDANWKPTNLDPTMYIKGLNMGNIDNYSYSANTFQVYVHYALNFPNDDMQPLLAGNYLLKIFRNFNDQELIITRRFMVLNQLVSVTGSSKPATDGKFRFSKQEVDVYVDYTGYSIPNPNQDVKLVMLQNCRWDNAITGLKPLFVSGNQLNYNYEDGNLFNGGNEFRFFDTRSLRFFSQNIEKKYFDQVTQCVLKPDESRAKAAYFQYLDFNGKRVLENKDGTTDGDYARMYFRLMLPDSFAEPVYVFGEFSDWQPREAFRMTYDPLLKMYTCNALLKQGYYNYAYGVLTASGKLDETLIEGNHMETRNDYNILVYHRNLIFDYDELVGAAYFDSGGVR